MLMIVCAVLTWIIPAGAYETEKVGNLNKVIAGTYHVIDSTPWGPGAFSWQLWQAFTNQQS